MRDLLTRFAQPFQPPGQCGRKQPCAGIGRVVPTRLFQRCNGFVIALEGYQGAGAVDQDAGEKRRVVRLGGKGDGATESNVGDRWLVLGHRRVAGHGREARLVGRGAQGNFVGRQIEGSLCLGEFALANEGDAQAMSRLGQFDLGSRRFAPLLCVIPGGFGIAARQIYAIGKLSLGR